MSTKKVIASYVVELTESASGFQWITVTQQGQSEGFSARRAIATSLDISETIQQLSKELLSTSASRLLYRC